MTLRPRLRQGAIALVALLLMLSTVSSIAVAQTATGGTIIVEEGQTSDGISAAAGTIVIRGTVNGDVSALAGDIVVEETGVVDGRISGAAGSLRIDGTVNGDVRFAGGSVTFGAPSVVNGEVSLGAGNAVFAGTINGPVSVGAEQITVAPSAVIGGDLRYDGQLDLQQGATVQGQVVRDTNLGMGPSTSWTPGWSLPAWFDTVYGFLANLVLGAFLLLLFPRFSDRVADTVTDRPLHSGLWGFLGLIGIPIVLVLIAITIIGIPITVIGILLFAMAAWIAVVYGEYAVGRFIITRTDNESRWASLIVGLVLFSLLGFIPFLGGLAVFLAFLLGLGALGMSLRSEFGHRRGRDRGPTAADAPEDSPSTNSTDDTSPSDAPA